MFGSTGGMNSMTPPPNPQSGEPDRVVIAAHIREAFARDFHTQTERGLQVRNPFSVSLV